MIHFPLQPDSSFTAILPYLIQRCLISSFDYHQKVLPHPIKTTGDKRLISCVTDTVSLGDRVHYATKVNEYKPAYDKPV